MEDKVIKSSFLLSKALLPDLIKFLGSFDIRRTPLRKFHLFSGTIMDSQLAIYKSGIVVFEESPKLIKILEEFFVVKTLPIPLELETATNKLEKKNNDNTKQPGDMEISSYWISEEQIEILIGRYQSRGFEIVSRNTKKHKFKICKSDTNCIEISKNGIMKSNSISDYMTDLDFVFENHPIDKKGRFYIGFESIGKYSQIGPIVYAIVGINSEQSTLLQKYGVRHMKIGRNNDPDRYIEDVEKCVTFHKLLIINPEDINSNDFETIRSDKFKEFFSQIQQMIPDNISITVSYNNNIEKEFLNYNLSKSPLLKNTEDSMSSAAASITAKYTHNHWMKDKSHEYELLMNKENIEQIAKLPEKAKLLKFKYVSSER